MKRTCDYSAAMSGRATASKVVYDQGLKNVIVNT
jgi:hypothetical protein